MWFLKPKKRWPHLTLFDRPGRPMCFEKLVLHGREGFERFLDGVFASPLGWYWESELPQEPAGPEYRLPTKRGITRLTPATATDLFEDLEQPTADGYGRFVAIFGVDGAQPDWLSRGFCPSPQFWSTTRVRFRASRGRG